MLSAIVSYFQFYVTITKISKSIHNSEMKECECTQQKEPEFYLILLGYLGYLLLL